MLKEGIILGERYEIMSRIGTGGMADVYKAQDLKLNRMVAVKGMKAYIDIAQKLHSDIVLGWAKGNVPAGGDRAKYMRRLAKNLKILDSYDQGLFTNVQNQVFDFSEKAGDQTYWLAKSFLLLGDSYVEQEEWRQARATFESIRDGYSNKEDEILDNVQMRLKKLSAMNK